VHRIVVVKDTVIVVAMEKGSCDFEKRSRDVDDVFGKWSCDFEKKEDLNKKGIEGKHCDTVERSCDDVILASDWLEKKCDCGENEAGYDLDLDFLMTYFWLLWLGFEQIVLLVFTWISVRSKHKYWIRFCLACCKPR